MIRISGQTRGTLNRFFVAGDRTRYIEAAYVLLLPIAVWFIYRFALFNNNDGFFDSWIYFGYVHNFQDLVDRYGLPYYSVRFGLIFPLLLLTEILGPLSGYVAFVYIMYLLAGIPFYVLFRRKFSVHAAAAAYAILIGSPWFARTVLWTHPDAAAVPYLIAATSLLFLEPVHRRLSNFSIGVLVALAVNSNFFSLAIGGLLGVAYLAYFKENLWRRLGQDAPWILAGFVMVFAAGSIGYYVCCDQYNFLRSTLDMVKWSNSGAGVAYKASLPALLKINYLYVPPFILAAMPILYRQASAIDRRLVFAAASYLLATSAFYVWYELRIPAAILELHYYFSFFLAPAIVCIALVPIHLAKDKRIEPYLLTLAAASFLLPPLILTYADPFFFDRLRTGWLLAGLAVSLLLLLLTLRFRNITPCAILAVALSINISLLSTVLQGVPFYARMYGVSEKNAGINRYRLGLKFIETMPKFVEDRCPILFWYSNEDQLANSLQSTYLWGYSRVHDSKKETPGLPSLNGVNLDLLRKPSSLVVFDRNPGIVEMGIEELRRVGIRFTTNKGRKICEEDICYMIAVLNVDRVPSKAERDLKEGRLPALSVGLDWSQPGEGAKIESEGRAVSLTTPPKAWNYGGVASVVFSDPRPAGRGVIRVLVTVAGASAGVGVTGSDGSTFIRRVKVLPKDEPQEVFMEFDSLDEVKKFVVQTWDKDKAARVQVLDFAARRLTQASK